MPRQKQLEPAVLIGKESGKRQAVRQAHLPKNRLYSLVDLFAGCGGLSLGLENAQFTPVFVNELNPDARETYLRNRHHVLGGMKFSENPALHCADAHDLQGDRLEELVSELANIPEVGFRSESPSSLMGGSNLDLIAGGPPCQGYSGIGIRRSYAVDKKDIPSNQLYVRMAAVIRRLRPRMFLFENVRGLLNAKWTKEGADYIWPNVKSEFEAIPGYHVRWSLVFAKDYGVPQNRPRVLLVGIRSDIAAASPLVDLSADPVDAVTTGLLPAPQPKSYPDLYDLLGDLVDDRVASILRSGDFPRGPFVTTEYPKPAKTDIQRELRRAPAWLESGIVTLTEQEYSKHAPEIVKKFDYMLANKGEMLEEHKTKKFSQRVLRARWGEGDPNITATSLPDDYVHFAQPRSLTVREWARLQLFPDWYQFAGKRTTGGLRRAGNPQQGLFDREVPKYTQIGNAVPVRLAEKVGNHLRSIIDSAV